MAALRLVARSFAASLLALSLLGGSTATRTAEQAARDARSALGRSQLEEAQRIIDDALRRFDSRDDETIWALRVMRAEVTHLQGDQVRVRKLLKDELPPALRNSEPAVRRLWTLGNAAIKLRQANEAARQLERARAIAEAHQPQMLPEIYTAMSTSASDLKQAEDYAAKAVAAALKYKKPRFQPWVLAALQYQYNNAGRYADAVVVGEKALAAAQSQKMGTLVNYAAGNLGWTYIDVGDYETAADYFSLADQTAAQADRVPWLIQLGNLCLEKHDWPGAERYYRDARSLVQDDTQRGFILDNLAAVAVETGKYAEALEYNREALKVKLRAKDKESIRQDSILRSRIIEARIATGEKKFATAEATLRDVIRKTKNATIRWEASGRLAQVFVKTNRVAEAVEQYQQAVDTVRTARAAIGSDLRLSFYNSTADIFSDYIDFLIRQQRIAGALRVTEEIRGDTIDDALDTKTSHPAVDPRIVAKQQSATILSYWLGSRHSYVWTITPSEVYAARLASEAEITDAVERQRRELQNVNASWQQGRRLFSLVPPAARRVPRDGRIIVVADGALHGLNFDTLVVPTKHYWIEDAVITNASSIEVLARPPAMNTRTSTMLLVGNPLEAEPSYPPLANAAAEMSNISRHFAQVKKLEGAAATPDGYLAASPSSFDFIHFVAHGVAFRKRPLDSAVILGRDKNNEYKLLARDVVKQRLNARLVTISSCHGAGTRTFTGEGLVGLAWSFLHAGASNVIAALWEVNDSSTPKLMDDFYKRTVAGADPAKALRDAKLAFVHADDIHRYPKYWAPFVFYSG